MVGEEVCSRRPDQVGIGEPRGVSAAVFQRALPFLSGIVGSPSESAAGTSLNLLFLLSLRYERKLALTRGGCCADCHELVRPTLY
jgi:hypothetical protein